MKTSEVTAYYETQTAAAKALGINQSNVSDWGEYPPDRRQVQIEVVTKGALKAEPGCYERLIGLDKVPKEAA